MGINLTDGQLSELSDAARDAWHEADETGEEDYDVLWQAVVIAVIDAFIKLTGDK